MPLNYSLKRDTLQNLIFIIFIMYLSVKYALCYYFCSCLQGRSKDANESWDVYCFGWVIFEILSEKRPFQGKV